MPWRLCIFVSILLNVLITDYDRISLSRLDSAAFSVTMSGTEARLYISWKHSKVNYYMQRTDGFYVQDPEQYLKFCKRVQNVLDWGKDIRLKAI
jgi:hypothetical protein